MTYSNDNLIRRFVDGETSGKCNRMAIAEYDGWTLLWGYGHALYAARRKDDGLMFVYDGWYGRSQTTSTHLNKLKGKAKGRYGEPRDDGDGLRVLVGDDSAQLEAAPPSGRQLIIVDEGQPGTSYGTLSAEGRPELSQWDGKHVPSPGGTSSR